MKAKILSKKYFKGFTLVETMVAIAILAAATTGVLTAVQSGLQDTTIAKDQIVAFYLAQEGMEFIKNWRDENTLHTLSGTPTNWLAGLSAVAGDPCYFGRVCEVDSPAKSVTFCGNTAGSCENLRQQSDTGLYGYNFSWTSTYFKREIQFQQISADEIIVLMTISWTNRGQSNSFQVTESFYNR